MRRLIVGLVLAAVLAPGSAAALNLSPRAALGLDGGFRYSSLAEGAGFDVGGFGTVMVGPVAFGLRTSWNVDRTLKKKEFRRVARISSYVHVSLALSFGLVDVLAGAGPGVGWARDPETTERLPSWGVHEYVAVFLGEGVMTPGLRVEFQQLWQPELSDEMDFGVTVSFVAGLSLR